MTSIGGSAMILYVGGAGDDYIQDVEGAIQLMPAQVMTELRFLLYNAADINTITGGTGSDTYVFSTWVMKDN